MRVKSLKSIPATLTKESFSKSVNILITKPHVVNKRLWGSKILYKCSYKSHVTEDLPISLSPLDDIVSDGNVLNKMSGLLNELKVCSTEETADGDDGIIITLVELLPKTYTDKSAYQLVCLQVDKMIVTFYNVTPVQFEQNLCPEFTYNILLNNNEVCLTAFTDESSKSYQWLINTVLPQFIKWGNETISTKSNICSESLTLVSKTGYYEKYNDLKLKYGKEMVKIWPECTDPAKFVYEDVAIAAYLLLLWEQDGNKKKTFVDLGCGNGLLVYILAKEGHQGVGLDVRKRNIWDIYPPEVVLQEKTITPSDTAIFPDVDWVIGNHSDELTPWIPVITAKSSYTGNFFLLPCCAYNFDGSKYQRKNSYNSQYMDYLGYIKQLSEYCGFNVDTDRLKIPSTKRICLVSSGRTYPKEEHEQYCRKIDNIVNCGTVTQDVSNDFKAREAVEKVRNCTQIDKNVINTIVDIITKYLLGGCKESDTSWSIGRTAEINELVQLIPKDQLTILKSECGGLQTLMKNNHHIFKVQSGKVELRYPKSIEEVQSNSKKRKSNQAAIKIQQKPCWFHNNHPQGCPLKDTECSFLHVQS
ncbi:putative tRNA (uracil-O(2)-)-methyltransferase [Anticarsia gemmatalis]|uniref:putative tRNA (uracil-O(2)-)-methyltransferase n=1 Tax=Anticarsia gemmatalis TaxID=129554 RepID=UPI003F75B0C5